MIQEGAIPSSLAKLLRPGLDLMGLAGMGKGALRDVFGRAGGGIEHTQVWLAMGYDDAAGVMRLDEQGQPRIDWPREQRLHLGLDKSAAMFRALSKGGGGVFIDNPREALSTPQAAGTPISVHLLGGCRMADSGHAGVVDHVGRVWDPATGGVHPGLYVLDGSICSTSLGANPLLTITALAERAAEHIKEDDLPALFRLDDDSIVLDVERNQWVRAAYGRLATPSEPQPPAIRFVERFEGSIISLDAIHELVVADLDVALHPGPFDASVDGQILSGRVEASSFFEDDRPAPVRGGWVRLDPHDRRMFTYAIAFDHPVEPRSFVLHGVKTLTVGTGGIWSAPMRIWRDTTTLRGELLEIGANPSQPLDLADADVTLGKFDMAISPRAFAGQVASLRIDDTDDAFSRTKLALRFGATFARAVARHSFPKPGTEA